MTHPDQTPSNPESPENSPEAPQGPMCRHLRSKGMYVYTDGVDMGFDHDYDNTIYWCLKTMKSFGPDDEMVEKYTESSSDDIDILNMDVYDAQDLKKKMK